MFNKKEEPTNTPPEGTSWEAELKRIGFVRRLLMGRHWYGADWWFVVISSIAVLGFIIVAIFPGVFAPYSPDELVGPRFLAPGEIPPQSVMVVPADSSINELRDLATATGAERPKIAVVQGVSTAGDLNAQAQKIDQELKNQPEGLRLRPVISRYETLELALQAVADGKASAAVILNTEFETVKDQFTTLREGNSISGEAVDHGFVFGTNDIGQDIFSRMIWGTRIAIIIGFSSALLSLFLGVPLGLLAGFLGGSFDRLLSLLMDSLYSFPGLILAIAITAVLGPSIFNIIVAISVLYIPTYYRIVRGQTLQVKEEVYVEAARSIGSRRNEILRRYIFPNVIPSVAIIFSINVADAILTGAGLSFLGLGLPPTMADWGIDLARGQRFIQNAWWMITFPGLAILLVVLSFTLLGEGLTEIFNPKLRDR
ncbi:MAG: ABC transporter permease subunit [Anaerolineaceae bacterium]